MQPATVSGAQCTIDSHLDAEMDIECAGSGTRLSVKEAAEQATPAGRFESIPDLKDPMDRAWVAGERREKAAREAGKLRTDSKAAVA